MLNLVKVGLQMLLPNRHVKSKLQCRQRIYLPLLILWLLSKANIKWALVSFPEGLLITYFVWLRCVSYSDIILIIILIFFPYNFSKILDNIGKEFRSFFPRIMNYNYLEINSMGVLRDKINQRTAGIGRLYNSEQFSD